MDVAEGTQLVIIGIDPKHSTALLYAFFARLTYA